MVLRRGGTAQWYFVWNDDRLLWRVPLRGDNCFVNDM